MLKHHTNFAGKAFICSILSSGICLAAGSAPAAAGSGTGSGGSAAHAETAAPAAAAPAASSSHAATPSAPVQSAPGANPTTPAGTTARQTPTTPNRIPPANEVAPPTDNGAGHHPQHIHNQQYEAVYGNTFLPNANGWYNNGAGSVGNVNNNAGLNSNDNTVAQPAAPSPTPAAPVDNSTSIAAQAANAVDHSPEVVASGNAIQQAQAAFEADRQRVISELNQKPEYLQALGRQKDATKDMKDVKPIGAGSPPVAVMDAAAAKLEASDEVTKMQEQAIAADPQAKADKDRLTQLVGERDAQQARLRSQH